MKAMVSFLCFLLLSSLSPIVAELQDEQPSPADILGSWQQYVDLDDEWIYLATFEVTKKNDVYAMRCVHITGDIPIIESRGIKDISFDGKTWKFLSDWGKENGGWALFKLNKVEPYLFLGYSYLNGSRVRKNLWLQPEM
jgi:hypothetical protein